MGFLLCRYQALVSTGLQQSANSAMNFTSSEEVKNVLSEAFALQSQSSSSSSRRRRLQQTSEEDLEALADVSAVVADEIARGLGFDTEETVEECRSLNMYLDDFTCCKGACGETC